MKNLMYVKKGILIGLGFLITICLGTFAYQFTDYTDIDDVESEQVLTKDTFNQLLANIRDLDSRLNTLSGNLNTLELDYTNTSSYSNLMGYNIAYLGAGATGTELYTDYITLNKGMYVVYYYHNIASWVPNDGSTIFYSVEGATNPSNFYGLHMPYTQLHTYLGNPPIIFSIKDDNTKVRFKLYSQSGHDNVITNSTTGNRSRFYYYQLSH